ncbi:cytochrome P450 [Shimia biformata]|uniref:cytochrome P450 n=1 Tax=Shimia biformata TaxID=1294299 RepID=UPI00194F882A|nr:cytochrome P450 [Shimia biformata]
MSTAPEYTIDPARFAADPYPDLAQMRRDAPICFVPQLNATLFTRRDDIFRQEKRIEVFSSRQPEGLMTLLMGENLMRKDGDAHMAERRALFPTLSPKTVKQHWLPLFRDAADRIIRDLIPQRGCDLVRDFAMPVSAEALKAITGLTTMTAAEMDGVSQAMIDGCANYQGDPQIEAACHRATALIDAHIDAQVPVLRKQPDPSALSVQLEAGLPMESIRANIKLIISGGQNEPRDAIAGTIWALLTTPDAMGMIRNGGAGFVDAFHEYARWVSPIGMSPREVAQADTVNGIDFTPGERVFFMFGSAGRDEAHFDAPDRFDITRDNSAAIPFGAGPHFCAGAPAARAMITEVALPLAFQHLQDLELAGPVPFHGWAFRGPLSMPVTWSNG